MPPESRGGGQASQYAPRTPTATLLIPLAVSSAGLSDDFRAIESIRLPLTRARRAEAMCRFADNSQQGDPAPRVPFTRAHDPGPCERTRLAPASRLPIPTATLRQIRGQTPG
jgi:hypothetical protein